MLVSEGFGVEATAAVVVEEEGEWCYRGDTDISHFFQISSA